jgi:hypothetical protein
MKKSDDKNYRDPVTDPEHSSHLHEAYLMLRCDLPLIFRAFRQMLERILEDPNLEM